MRWTRLGPGVARRHRLTIGAQVINLPHNAKLARPLGKSSRPAKNLRLDNTNKTSCFYSCLCVFIRGYFLTMVSTCRTRVSPAPGLEEPVPFSSRRGVQATMAAYANVAPRDPVSNASCRRIGTGRGSETGCVLASEQLFFDFRIARRLPGACGRNRAGD